jgi:hypothetical protein
MFYYHMPTENSPFIHCTQNMYLTCSCIFNTYMYTTLRAVKSPCYCKQHSKIVLCTLHIKNWKLILYIKKTACYFSVKELTLYIPLAVFDCLFILYSLLNIFRRRLAIYFLRCDGKYM